MSINKSILDRLRENFPSAIRGAVCKSDLKKTGVAFRDKEHAISTFSRIDIGENKVYAIPLDFDINSYDALSIIENLPTPPNLVIKNLKSGHTQIWYVLNEDDLVFNRGSKAFHYMRNIRKHMTRTANADPHHHNYVTYNPWHKDFTTSVWNNNSYSLSQLATWFDLPPETNYSMRHSIDHAIPNHDVHKIFPSLKSMLSSDMLVKEGSRNSFLFEQSRRILYSHRGLPDDQLLRIAKEVCHSVNNKFMELPLPEGEVNNTASSIAQYIMLNRATLFSGGGCFTFKERNGRDRHLYKGLNNPSFRDKQVISGKETSRIRKERTRNKICSSIIMKLSVSKDFRRGNKGSFDLIKGILKKKLTFSRQTIDRHWDEALQLAKDWFIVDKCPNGNIRLVRRSGWKAYLADYRAVYLLNPPPPEINDISLPLKGGFEDISHITRTHIPPMFA